MMKKASGLASVLLLATVNAAPEADRVKSVPGYSGPAFVNQYSGYLNITGGKHLHYVYVESEMEEKAPLLLWLNGGPGCSSLDGYVYEHGPFIFDGTEGSLPTLRPRPYRWNLLANVLYLEAPVGVGFSYADDPSVYQLNTDDTTAADNLAALERFFELFPETVDLPFFLSGESYAGIYVPTLAEAIHNAEEAGQWKGAKLTGIAVGNGCTGTETGVCGQGSQGDAYMIEYLLGTSFVDFELKRSIIETCDLAAAIDRQAPFSDGCQALLERMHKEVGFVDLYNIFGDCVTSYPRRHSKPPIKAPHNTFLYKTQRNASTSRSAPGEISGPVACIDSMLASAYFNSPEGQEAYNIRPPNGADSRWTFSVCGQATEDWSYRQTRPNLPRDTYPTLTKNYRVLIYNGDFDACVPFTDNQRWTQRMGFPVKQSWHAWNYTSTAGAKGQVGGHAVEYDVGPHESSGGRFTFITIRGGRHEVPMTAPAQALEMLRRFFDNVAF